MADGSHFGFIQKPVTFEPFELTTLNLVFRLSTYPEFSQILKFAVFLEMQDGRWQLSWIYSKSVTFEPFEITTPNLVSRLSTTPEFGQILKFSVFSESKMADGSHLGFIQNPVTFEPF